MTSNDYYHMSLLPNHTPKFPPHTELLDLQPQPVTALREPRFEQLYSHLKSKTFNPIQTQTFTQLYETDENVLVCAPTGSGKTICAEFALLRMLASAPKGSKPRCVYVAPKPAIANSRFADWSKRFGDKLGLEVTQLTGETAADLTLSTAPYQRRDRPGCRRNWA